MGPGAMCGAATEARSVGCGSWLFPFNGELPSPSPSARQWRGLSPSSVWTHDRVLKEGTSGGCVGTTNQGASRVRALGGERQWVRPPTKGKGSWEVQGLVARPIFSTSFRQQSTQASCPSPPSPQEAINRVKQTRKVIYKLICTQGAP